MLDDLAISLQMPLGDLTITNAATLLASFQVEKIYGLILADDNDEFSHTISISANDDDTAKCYTIMKSRVKLNLETSELEFQVLPFELIQLGNLLTGCPLPVSIRYNNIDVASIEEAFTSILNPDGTEEGQSKLANFLAGNKWVTVNPGSYVGKGALNASARRVVGLTFKEQSGLYLNPAHYLFRFPNIDEFLTDHPLLLKLQPVQGTAILQSSSNTYYVSKTGSTPTSPYTTRATAADMINNAIVLAQPGDTVLVLDTAVYDEVVDIPNGVKLMSVVGINLTEAVKSTNVLPTINHSGIASHAITFDGVKSSHISGFRIKSDTITAGCGVMVYESEKIEIKNNIIEGNVAISGGGMHITGSSKIEVSSNFFINNKAEDPTDSRYGGGGGGLFIDSDCNNIHVDLNTFEANRATSFGGAIGVYGATYVKIENNEIGGDALKGNKVTGDRLPYEDSILLDNPKGGGGGIGVYYGDIHDSGKAVRILLNNITYNEAHSGGGIEFYAGAFGLIKDCYISNNITRPEIPFTPFPLGGDGGGLAVNNTALTYSTPSFAVVKIEGSLIESNRAYDDGGGIYGTANALIKIKQSTIRNNTTPNNGGGIRLSFGSNLWITDTEISGNSANTGSTNGGGGGLALRNSFLEMKNCNIRENAIQNFGGGGIYIVTLEEGGSWLPGVPTADDILKNSYGYSRSRIFIEDTIVTLNSTNGVKGAGGGLYVVYDEYDIGISIKNSSFGLNTSTHSDPDKRKNIVLQDNSFWPDDIINDLSFANISPISSYNSTLSPGI